MPSGRVLHMRSQVEEAKRGIAKGTPVAIQQHQDIITVNYPARAAGVKKHMRPAEVRHSSCAEGKDHEPALAHSGWRSLSLLFPMHAPCRSHRHVMWDARRTAGAAAAAGGGRRHPACAHGAGPARQLRPLPCRVARHDQAAQTVQLICRQHEKSEAKAIGTNLCET